MTTHLCSSLKRNNPIKIINLRKQEEEERCSGTQTVTTFHHLQFVMASEKDSMWSVLNYDPQEAQQKQNTYKAIELPPIARNRSVIDITNNSPGYNKSFGNEPLPERKDFQSLKPRLPSQSPLYDQGEQPMRLPFVSTGASRQDTAELYSKVRELEINMLDLKSSMDRRMAQMTEEIPMRLQRELKNIESRDQHLWKDNQAKQTSLFDQMNRMREQQKMKQSEIIDKVSNFQTVVSETDYKVQSLAKQIELLQQISPGAPPSGNQQELNLNQGLSKYERENEIKGLKEMIAEERQKREKQNEDAYKQYNHLQSVVQGLGGELMKKFKEHREDQLYIYSSGEEERQRIERMKAERIDSDSQYVKVIVQTLEKRLEDEQQFRQKNEEDSRRYFENKFIGLQEKLKNEEKCSLEREKRLVSQFQEGLITMNEIIRGTKEQNMISISHQQTLLGDQMKNLIQTVEQVKDSVFDRQTFIEGEINEQKHKINELEQATFKHAKSVSETLETEINRFERVISAFEKYIDTQTSELRQLVQTQNQETHTWRIEYEDVNTKKVIEIHNALKLLNSNIGKSNTDSKDRYDMLNNEMMVFENACNSMIADLKNKVKVDDNSLEERIQLAVERIKERLTSQLDGAVLDYNKLVRDNNRLLQEKFEQNNHDVKSFIEKKTDEMRGKIIEERKKLDTIVEGRCQAFTIEIERKILQKMNLVMNENQTLREEMLKRLETAYKEQDLVARGLVEERLKIDAKLSQKEHDIKGWALKNLEENYTDYHRLLGAKLTEQENKVKQMLVNFKPKTDVPLKGNDGALSELTLKEAVDNLGMALKTDLLSLFEDDRKMKNIRFQEVFHLMDSNKNLINEHIGQQFESLKALTKAFVGKEVAERIVGDESILGSFNKRLDGIDLFFDNKLKDEVKIMTDRLNDQRQAIENEKQENEKVRQQMEENAKKLEEDQNAKMGQFQEKMEKDVSEKQQKQQEQLEKTEEDLKEEMKQQKERNDQAEVQAALADMINKISQDHMDEKFEDALNEVANSIDQYVGIVNDTSSKQYDDFNTNLKKAFGQNLQQIQDMVTNLHEELEKSKEKQAKMEKELNDVDYNSKKSVEEVKDKIEVERCVVEMVSWVAEQISDQQNASRLTNALKKSTPRSRKSKDKDLDSKQETKQKEPETGPAEEEKKDAPDSARQKPESQQNQEDQ